ncbi:MAG: hypothetical protein ACK4WD_01395, partial [Flavobacteriales bacterium]
RNFAGIVNSHFKILSLVFALRDIPQDIWLHVTNIEGKSTVGLTTLFATLLRFTKEAAPQIESGSPDAGYD